MKLLERLPARVAFSTGALLAVTLASGSAAAVAAPAHARAGAAVTSKFTWHAFKLLNGWGSASVPKLKTGTPSWALRGGVIYLRGAVKVTTTEKKSTFATLPKVAQADAEERLGLEPVGLGHR